MPDPIDPKEEDSWEGLLTPPSKTYAQRNLIPERVDKPALLPSQPPSLPLVETGEVSTVDTPAFQLTASEHLGGVKRHELRFNQEKMDEIVNDLKNRREKLRKAQQDLRQDPEVRNHLAKLESRTTAQIESLLPAEPEPEESDRELHTKILNDQFEVSTSPSILEGPRVVPGEVAEKISPKKEAPTWESRLKSPIPFPVQLTLEMISEAGDEFSRYYTEAGEPGQMINLARNQEQNMYRRMRAWSIVNSMEEAGNTTIQAVDKKLELWDDGAIAMTPDEDLPLYQQGRKQVVLQKYADQNEMQKLAGIVDQHRRNGTKIEFVYPNGKGKNAEPIPVVVEKFGTPIQDGIDENRAMLRATLPKDVVVPVNYDPYTQKELWSISSWRPGIKEANRAEAHLKKVKSERWNTDPTQLTEEQKDELDAIASVETDRMLASVMQTGKNKLIIDSDPGRTIDAILELPAPLQAIAASVVPQITFSQKVSPLGQTYGMMEVESPLDYLMRLMPDTLFASAFPTYSAAFKIEEQKPGDLRVEKFFDAALEGRPLDAAYYLAQERSFLSDITGGFHHGSDWMATAIPSGLSEAEKVQARRRHIEHIREGHSLTLEFTAAFAELGNALEVSLIGSVVSPFPFADRPLEIFPVVQEGDLVAHFALAGGIAGFAGEIGAPDPISPLIAGASLAVKAMNNTDRQMLRVAKRLRGAKNILKDNGIEAAQAYVKDTDRAVQDLIHIGVQQKLGLSPKISNRLKGTEFVEEPIKPGAKVTLEAGEPPKFQDPETGEIRQRKKEDRLAGREELLQNGLIEEKNAQMALDAFDSAADAIGEYNRLAAEIAGSQKKLRAIQKRQNAIIPVKKIKAFGKYDAEMQNLERARRRESDLEKRLQKELVKHSSQAKPGKGIKNRIAKTRDQLDHTRSEIRSSTEKVKTIRDEDIGISAADMSLYRRLTQQHIRIKAMDYSKKIRVSMIAERFGAEMSGAVKSKGDWAERAIELLRSHRTKLETQLKVAKKARIAAEVEFSASKKMGKMIDKHGDIKLVKDAVEDIFRRTKARNLRIAYLEAIEETANAIEKGVRWNRAWRSQGPAARRAKQGLPELDDILRDATVSKDPKDGSRVVNFIKFHQSLVDRWGHEAVDGMLEMRGYAPGLFNQMLTDFQDSATLVAGEAGITKVFRAPGSLSNLSVKEAYWLQDLPRYLDLAEKRAHPHADSMAFVNTIKNSWNDPQYMTHLTYGSIWKPVVETLLSRPGLVGMSADVRNSLHHTVRKGFKSLDTLKRMLTVTASSKNLGIASDEIVGISEAGEHMSDNFRDEMLDGASKISQSVSKMSRDEVVKIVETRAPQFFKKNNIKYPDTGVVLPFATKRRREKVFRGKVVELQTQDFYMSLLDGGAPFPVFGKNSISNRGYNSVWEDAVWQITHDPESLLREVEGVFKTGDLWKARKEFDEKNIGKLDPETGEQVEFSVSDAMEHLDRAEYDSNSTLQRLKTGESGNTALVALSLSMIGSGVEPTQARALYHWTLAYLKRVAKKQDRISQIKTRNIPEISGDVPFVKTDLMNHGGMKTAHKNLLKREPFSTRPDIDRYQTVNDLREAVRLARIPENEFLQIVQDVVTRPRKDALFAARQVGKEVMRLGGKKFVKNLSLSSDTQSTLREYYKLLDQASPRKFSDSLAQQTRKANIADVKVHKSLTYMTLALHHAAVKNRVQDLMDHVTHGFLSDEVAHNFNKILSTGSGDVITESARIDPDAGYMGTIQSALQAFDMMGMPISRAVLKETDAAAKEIQRSLRLIKAGESKVGENIYMIKAQMDQLDANIPKILKELHSINVKSENTMESVLNYADPALRAWKQSIVTGIFLPRPDFWLTNFIGDSGQMYLDLGLRTSGKVALTSLPENIPYLGKKFAEVTHDMVNGVGKGNPDNVLAGPIASLFDPLSGGILRGDTGFFRNEFGVEIPYEDAVRQALELGIFDTMARAEFLNEFTRLRGRGGKWMDTAKIPSEMISQFATYTQSRMRFNLFLELLRKGESPTSAAKKVKSALYDWKHGISQGEVRTIARIIPFWRFWRLACKQTIGAFTDPWIRPNGILKKSMAADTRLARLRNTYKFKEQLPNLLDPEIAAAYDSESKRYDHIARYVRPSWARNRPLITTSRNTRERLDFWRGVRGSGYNPTHNMVLLPPLTAVDTAELLMLFPKALFAMAAGSGIIPHYDLAPDWKSSFMTPVLDTMNPAFKVPLEALLAGSGANVGVHKTGSWTSLTGWEYAMQTSGGFNKIFETRREPGTNKPQGRPLSTMVWRLIPVIGVELNRLLNPVWWENPARTEGFSSAMIYATSNYLGYKQRPFDPQREMFYRRDALNKQIAKAYSEATGEEFIGASEEQEP